MLLLYYFAVTNFPLLARRVILQKEFNDIPMNFIDATLNQSGYRLFSAYRVLEEARRTWSSDQAPYNKMKRPRKDNGEFHEEKLDSYLLAVASDPRKTEVIKELRASRRIRQKAEAQREAERRKEIEEEENLRKAEAEGTIAECGCCFGDFPLNRMVHCDNDTTMHWFCRACAKQNADTVIGASKYELACMSMDGCDSKFQLEQRSRSKSLFF